MYYARLDEQTHRTGGLTDTPPAAPVGNVRNVGNDREPVVGYFTASGVSAVRYWLTRKNTTSELPFAPGVDLSTTFFQILNQRSPVRESPPQAFGAVLPWPPAC